MSFIIIISSKDSMTILQDLFYPPSIAFIITLLYYIFYLLILFINLAPFTRMLHKWVQRFFTKLFTAVSPAPKTVFYTVCTLNKYLLMNRGMYELMSEALKKLLNHENIVI